MSEDLPDSCEPSIHEDASHSQGRRSPLWTGLAFLLAGIFLFLAFRGIDWPPFWRAFSSGRYEFLLLTVPIASFSYFLRSIRWGVFVRAEKKTPIHTIFWANMAGYLGNAVLPGRAGELVRSAFLGRESGLGTSFILATALAERIFDVIALVLIGSVALLLLTTVSTPLAAGLLLMAAAAGVGFIAFLVAPYFEKTFLGFADRLHGYTRFAHFARTQITRFISGVRSLHDGGRLTRFVVLTAVIWLTDAFIATINVRIVYQTLSVGQALILLSALGLSSAIPSTPGYIGPYQFAAVAVLVPFGFSQAEALAFILLSQVVNLCLVSFWGLIGVWHFRAGSKTPSTKTSAETAPEPEKPAELS